MTPPKVLVVGGGGREHALVCALHDSPEHPAIFAAPGNPGMEPEATLLRLRATDVPGLVVWAEREKPDLVVIGPDAAVAIGLADALAKISIPVLGPVKAAGRLESSKSYTKQILEELGLPTAPYRLAHSAGEAKRILAGARYPIVLKADGLAAGKGVVVAERESEAFETIGAWMERGELGESGKILVIEDFLQGEEASLLVLTDGERWMLFPPARDHKRAYEGDQGPNTGGMGANAPAGAPTSDEALAIARRVVDPLLRALRERGTPYRGILYLGLMLTGEARWCSRSTRASEIRKRRPFCRSSTRTSIRSSWPRPGALFRPSGTARSCAMPGRRSAWFWRRTDIPRSRAPARSSRD